MATKIDMSEFYKLSRPKKRPCPVNFAAPQLTDLEQAQLQTAVEADGGIITSGAIQQWLKARGHDVSVPAVTAHRKGVCSCGD